MTMNKIRRALKLGLLAGSLLVTALVATAGTALAERPVAGHWVGTEGVRFHVTHEEHMFGGHTRITHIHFHAIDRFPHAVVGTDGEFESCISHHINLHMENHTCVRGRFSSHHHASGTVIKFLAPVSHPHVRGVTHRYEWTASPESD